MKRMSVILASGMAICASIFVARVQPQDVKSQNVKTGQAAFSGYETQKPGAFRKITAADLPAPFASESVRNYSTLVPRPANAWIASPGRPARQSTAPRNNGASASMDKRERSMKPRSISMSRTKGSITAKGNRRSGSAKPGRRRQVRKSPERDAAS